MADQDLKINIVTLADLTGIRLTQEQLDALQSAAKQGNIEAIEALKKLSAAQQGVVEAQKATVGFAGSTVGIGTIISLLTAGISKWKEFNDEQDRWVEGMIKAEEKTRALGEAILDMQDKARSAARIGVEPLEVSFARLTQDVIRLKTEIDIAFKAGEFDEVKRLNADLGITQSQLKGVTDQLQRRAEAEKKAVQAELEKRVPGLKAPEIKEADAQVQAILKNEQAAAAARAAGREREADLFQKSADQYKKSATPQQLADLQRIHELQDKLKPPPTPAYRALTPEEFQRQSEAAEPTGPGKKLTGAEMRQAQLEAEAARKAEIENTRKAAIKAEQDRQEELEKKGVVPGELERQQSKDASIAAKLDQILAHQKAVWGY